MAADRAQMFPGKHFISTILDALEAKTAMSGLMRRRYLQRAAMAGILIGLMYVVNYTVISTFAALPAGTGNLAGVGRMVGALAFGWALVFIYYSKSELLTSNMMIVAIGTYHRRIRVVRSLRLLGLCYLGNALGGLLVALLDRFSTVLGGPIREEIDHAVATKLGYVSAGWSGWGDLFVRAVLCNLLINLTIPPSLPWHILPLPLYTLGMSLTMPSLTLLALDRFPAQRGLAASCQMFLQSMNNSVLAGVIAPLAWGSTLSLSVGMAVLMLVGAGCSLLHYRLTASYQPETD